MSAWAVALVLAAAAPDKAALFGEPSLVPTRAGERAREELALAAAVASAVAARADGGAPVVEVRLPAAGDGGAVVVAGAVALAPEEVVRIAEAVVGAWSVGRVEVFAAGAGAGTPEAVTCPDAAGGPRWPLMLALTLFGASAGVAVDRLRRRARDADRGAASLYATRR